MSVKKADALLEEAAADIAAAESGEGEHRLYEHAALRIEEAMQENPGLTQRDIAAKLERNVSYVNRLLKELLRSRATTTPFRIDWGSGKNNGEQKDARALKRAKPEDLVQAMQEAIEQAPPEKRKQLVDAVTDTSTVAGRHIDNQVRERDLAEKRSREGSSEPLSGTPLEVMWTAICLKLEEWRRELHRFDEEDLDAIAGSTHGALRVFENLADLETEINRWKLRLVQGPAQIEDGNVIEGVFR